MASLPALFERNQEATIYIGNCDARATEELLWELFTQCGPVASVHMPRDKITGDHQGYGFVEFRSEDDADYAIKILHMIKLYGKPIKVNKASQDKRTQEIGANLFIGNLDPEVDEKMLYETFSAFGMVLSTRIMRNPETGLSKGYGFMSFDSFEASDACINAMNGQYFCNRTIHVSYGYKKDTKGERHGSAAERLLAANRPSTNKGGTIFNAPLSGSLQLPQNLVSPPVNVPGMGGVKPPPLNLPTPSGPSNWMPQGLGMQMPNAPIPNISGMGMPNMGIPFMPMQNMGNMPMQGMGNMPMQNMGSMGNIQMQNMGNMPMQNMNGGSQFTHMSRMPQMK